MAPDSGRVTLLVPDGADGAVGATTSAHPDRAVAHRHLMGRAVTSDLYLRTLEATDTEAGAR